MQTFLCRLIPPRATFPFDMSDDERRVMGEHAAYWHRLTDAGHCLLFGPVFAAGAPWGLGVLRVADEAAARALVDADPSVTASINVYELHPMPVAVVREPKADRKP